MFSFAQAQMFSNRGTDFWLGYGPHSYMFNNDGTIDTITGGSQEMAIYLTATADANVTIAIPALGWVKNYFVAANTFVESDLLPKTTGSDARIDSEGVFNTGIHITSDQLISAYGHIFANGSSASSLLLPTYILGQNYNSINFTQTSDVPNSSSYCFVVATQDSTVVQVTPSVATITHPAHVTFSQMLQKGQILNLMALPSVQNGNVYKGGDLTGTHIETMTDNSPVCKQIAVFSGSTSTSINCNPGTNSTSDNLMQEVLPAKAKGLEFITVPTKGMDENFFRIYVSDTSTVVTMNGVVLTNLIIGKYYQLEANQPSVIEATKGVLVAQYITSANVCGNNVLGNTGDPEMIYLTPTNLVLGTGSFYSTAHFNTTSNYINVVKATNDTTNTTLDNVSILPLFKKVFSDPLFSYAQIQVAQGTHILHTDSGFNAVAYGYGNLESYGYNLGFLSQPPDNFISIQNPYANPSLLQTCRATPFKLAVNFPFQPSGIQWNFFDNPILAPNDSVNVTDPDYDSTFQYNGITYYRYSLPGYYNISAVNNVPVQITVAKPTEDGCSDTTSYNYTIQVYDKPLANWGLANNACVRDSLNFIDSSNGFGRPLISWEWNFGNGDTSNLESPAVWYNNAGNYNTSLQVINDIGCFGDTVKPIFISSIPIANFGMAGVHCSGSTISFTDSSTIAVGNITQWDWNLGDGTTSNLQDLSKVYTADTFNISLWVYSAQNCVSDTATKTLIIYPYPIVTTPLDTFVVEGYTVQLLPAYAGTGLHYLWYPPIYLNSDTIPYPISTTKTSTFYQETVTGDGGCTSKADTYIEVVQFLEIPNVFSPNGDGVNDTWVIKNIERYADVTVQVFNRYGQPVFNSEGYYKPWDGTLNGKPLPVGVYYYIINTKDKYVPPSSGSITILR